MEGSRSKWSARCTSTLFPQLIGIIIGGICRVVSEEKQTQTTTGNPRISAHSKIRPWAGSGKNIPKNVPMGRFFCISEVTHAGSVPNNPPMGQLLGETIVSITCVINTLSGTWRSNEGATYYSTKYCCVKWKCRIWYDNIVSIIC